MFIYKITNKINGKVYIGQTINHVEIRFRRHINDALNNVLDTHFARAIRKYGEHNFEYEIIDTACSQQELTYKEQYWIAHYDSINSGYNETSASNKSGGNTYISKSEKEMSEIKNKIRKSKLGRNNPAARAIKCRNVETGIELQFDTLTQCQTFFDEKTHRFITTRVTGVTRSLYRKVWEIAYAEDEYGNFFAEVKKRGTPIKVIDLLSKEGMIFCSIRDAARTLKLSRVKMREAIRHGIILNSRYKIEILDKKCIDYP